MVLVTQLPRLDRNRSLSSHDLDIARRRLAAAQRVTVLTGAGVSAESGVPTFRGAGGLWENHRPEDLATPQAFARDPALVWRWYQWRRGLIAQCRPNPAHVALAGLERNKPRCTLITQNVDGLHRQAGSRDPLEIHGDIWRLRCLGCGRVWLSRDLGLPERPACPQCGGLARPDVVWFGEALDSAFLEKAWQAARLADYMLVAGTSALVQPAAGLAAVAKEAGAFVVEVNLEPTPNSAWVDVSLFGKAGDILPRLLEAL
ncbi:NAD-dependent protein deacylase [Desulfocarbo indianensis]|nr:NAD-dependent protein deacylase [Desulfocarbo indianensis]